MENENRTKRDLTFSFWATNFYAIILVLPIFIILFFMYSFIWENPVISFKYPYWIIYIMGVVVHELIHGFFAMKFTTQGIKSIKFGFAWKSLTPYCHCKEALTVKNYRIVLMSPLIILGIIPVLIGLLIGQNEIYGFGILFTLLAGGDLLIFWKLRKENQNSLVLDSPDKCGCEIYEAQKQTKK
ncbi:MAG: DUF3267 domain-containing protein [Bacteroidota bacterium]